MEIPRNKFACKFQGILSMGQKVIILFWWEIRVIVCVQKPPHHFLQTLRPLHMFKIVFRDSSLYPKQLSLFCLLRLISASADSNVYITSSCSMIEMLHELKKNFFKHRSIQGFDVSQQGKRKTKSLLDFCT